jgi:hypothetical protein
MIILKCTFSNKKITNSLLNIGIIRNVDQEVFNNFDDLLFFDLIFYKIEDALPTDNDEKYTSKFSQSEYEVIFDSFNFTQEELENQRNYLDAFTFSDKLYKKNLEIDYLEDIESEAFTGSVECFPKFTKKGVLWDVSSDDWDEDVYRVYSGITFSQLKEFNLSELLSLIQRENINDEILTEEDILEWYPDWNDDKEIVLDEIWDELKRINSEETRLGDLL